jgi:hypothetical protein
MNMQVDPDLAVRKRHLPFETERLTRASRTERRPASRPSLHRLDAGPSEERVGSVKWYNVQKGFGFVVADHGGKDVFMPRPSIGAA